VLQALLLFALLLTGALAGHEKVRSGVDPNGLQSVAPTSDLWGGLDPNGLQSAGRTADQLPGLDPDGAK
jgi:hypothetical protein